MSDMQIADKIQQRIQQAISRFEQLAGSEDPPTQVLQQVLATLTHATTALGGVVWMPGGPSQPYRATAQVGHAAALAAQQDGSPPPATAPVLARAAAQRKPIIASPNSPEFQATELKDTVQFFVPIDAVGRVYGVVQLIAPPDMDPKAYRPYAAFIQQGARAAGTYLARRQTQVISEDAANHAALLQITHKLLQVEAPADLIHESANLARALFEAQRVSVVAYWRRRGNVAVSDTIAIDRKAVLVRSLEMLADIVRLRQSPMTFVKGRKLEDDDEALEPLVEQVYSHGGAQALTATPVREGERITAVMIGEYADPALASRKASTQQEFCRQLGPILRHAVTAHRRPLRRTSTLLDKVRSHPLVSGLKAILAVALIAAAVYGLFFVPIDIVVRGDARLEPARLAQITAPVEGRIRRVLVKPGDPVTAGQVLLEIDDHQFQLLLSETVKSIEEERVKLESIRKRAEKDPAANAELLQSELHIQGLEIRRRRLMHEIEQTKVRAPLDGTILDEKLNRLENMTVDRGALLLRVADLNRFDLVTELREEDVALVDASIRGGRPVPVAFLSHAWPENEQRASIDSLQSLAPTSAPDELKHHHVYRVTAPIELHGVSEQLALANPTGRAKLVTGKGSVVYRFGRDLWRFIQMTLLF